MSGSLKLEIDARGPSRRSTKFLVSGRTFYPYRFFDFGCRKTGYLALFLSLAAGRVFGRPRFFGFASDSRFVLGCGGVARRRFNVASSNASWF